MDADHSTPKLKYISDFNQLVYRDYARRATKREWKRWFRFTIELVPYFCGVSLSAYICSQIFAGRVIEPSEAIVAAYVGFIAAPLIAILQKKRVIQNMVLQQRGLSWECELTEEFYQYTNTDGVVISVPWRWMKIQDEDPAYWVMSCRSFERVVFREPLRKAGLEQEFLRRVGAGAGE